MKKGTFILLFILLTGRLISTTWAMDDQFRTPPRPNHKRVCPSSEKRDPTFRPRPTPKSERKRLKVPRTCVASPSVRSWPRLLSRHELSQGFIERLAATELNDGTTMLHKAMKQANPHFTQNKISCTVNMIGAGADLTAKQGKDRDTPLHRWAMCPQSTPEEIEAVSHALRHRQRPDVSELKNIRGSTPLHLLCSQGLLHFSKFKALARWGISLDALNHYHQTVLHRLAQSSPDSNENKARILAFLSRYDLSDLINIRDWLGRTALYCAVQAGDIPTFDFLTQSPDIMLDTPDQDGNTALHAAVLNAGKRHKYADYFIKRLVRLGASKEAENDNGRHPRDLVSDRYHQLKQTLS